jgi:uncharacterized membrane protein YkoI
MQIYEIEFKQKYTEIDIKINAVNGDILEVKIDD